MEIRRYQQADRDAVWALHKMALHNAGVDLGAGPWDDDLAQIEQVYLNPRGEFLIGEISGRIVAMGALRATTETRGEIKRMRVHPDFQHRGLGQMILSDLEARAIALGYKMLHLDTSTLQVTAQHFYRKNGFVQVEKTDVVDGFTLIFFEKYLSPQRKER